MLTFFIIFLSLTFLTFLFMRGKDITMSNKHRKDKHRKPRLDIIAGELIVTSEDEIHIELPRRPKEVLALFGRHCEVTPCNPRHFDELKVYICHFHNHYCLVIKWNVANTRKIVWEAIF